jgi:hypothetical protein
MKRSSGRPRAADAWFNFATASWQLDDTAAAVIGWQRAMRLEPMAGDVRDRLRLAPGTPGLWHGVAPVSLTLLGGAGGTLWVAGFALLAIARRRRHPLINVTGAALAAGALVVLAIGVRQKEVIEGRNTAVVLSATRLREMPVLSSDPGIEALPGEVTKILGHQGAWTRIELTDRRRGWVEGARLQALSIAEGSFSITR